MIEITFHKSIDWGGIPITVTFGDQSVHLVVTDCCDPFPAMLCWLEAITTGVQCCYFDIDEEGTDKRLTLEQDWFSIINTYDESEVFLRAEIDPVQLVQAFYLGLIEYARSPHYIKTHWHGETLADRLTDIKESLLLLNREELRDALFIASPAHDVKFPGIVDEKQRKQKELFHTFDPDEEKGAKVTPVHWDIRKDFDQLSAIEKSEYIDELLGTLLDSPRGCHLSELHSPMIENWLSERI